MDTIIQLTLILRKDKYTRGVFQGVYPSDKLPTSILLYPALFIAIVDTSDKPGSHWLAFYFIKEKEGEFFDSYRPIASKQLYRNIYSFLEEQFSRLQVSPSEIANRQLKGLRTLLLVLCFISLPWYNHEQHCTSFFY